MVDFGRFPNVSRRSTQPSQLVIRELPACDPFALYAHIRQHAESSFILESAPGPKRLAEFTYIGFNPQHVLALPSDRVTVDGHSIEAEDGHSTRPFDALRSFLDAYRPPLDVRMPKYLGGLVGYLSYDTVRQFEPSLGKAPDRPSPPFPDFELGLYLDGIIIDHRRDRAFYVSHAEDRSAFAHELATSAPLKPSSFQVNDLISDTPEDAFCRNVERVKRAIHDGDVYQLVLSRQLSAQYAGDLFEVYRALRSLNPSPYMFCLEFGRGTDQERSIVGSSPEMLVSVREGNVITYPIAGTRPLGETDEEQARYRDELLADEKEAAEHAMLVDLARNDVGRVSQPGSVHVPEYRSVEPFSHVQHLVSRVEGRLATERDPFDALGALFPAGTVTGAPKVRAMSLIDELETSGRGPYAGAVGYASLTGDLDTAISIRTLFATHDTLYLQAGAGVVADSVPKREWAETEHKLGGLTRALEEASR